MTFLKQWWLSMGHWRWLNLAPVAIALYLSTQYAAMPQGWIEWGERQLGSTNVTLFTRGTVRHGEQLDVRLELSEPGSIALGFASHSMQAFEADSVQLQTELLLPDTPFEEAVLTVSRDQHRADWRIGRLIL